MNTAEDTPDRGPRSRAIARVRLGVIDQIVGLAELYGATDRVELTDAVAHVLGPLNERETAHALGLSHQRVQQITARALDKARLELARRGVTP